MKQKILAVITVLFALGVSYVILKQSQDVLPENGAVKNMTEHTGKTAPFFELYTYDRIKVSRNDLQGQFTVIHFWASWCAPCIEEIPAMLSFSEELSSISLVKVGVLFVSLDEKWEEALPFFEDKKLEAPMYSLLDEKKEMADAFGTYQLPETYLLSPDLKIIAKWVGAQKWQNEEVRKSVTDFFGTQR